MRSSKEEINFKDAGKLNNFFCEMSVQLKIFKNYPRAFCTKNVKFLRKCNKKGLIKVIQGHSRSKTLNMTNKN